MGEVFFDEEATQTPIHTVNDTNGLVGLVKRTGFAKTDKDAEWILIAAILISACVGIFILFSVYGAERKPPPPPPVPLGTMPYAQ